MRENVVAPRVRHTRARGVNSRARKLQGVPRYFGLVMYLQATGALIKYTGLLWARQLCMHVAYIL